MFLKVTLCLKLGLVEWCFKMPEPTIVKKDMGDDFNEKLSLILTQIDWYKQRLLIDKKVVVQLGERFYALFVKLYGKMKKAEMEEDIKKQQQLFKELDKSPPPCEISNRDMKGRISDPHIIFTKHYGNYLNLLKIIEQHLNECMENLGLTNVEREDDVRYD